MDVRFAALMLLSAASGAATILLADDSPGERRDAIFPIETVVPAELANSSTSAASLTGRIAHHREIARVTDSDSLSSLIRSALARPRSPNRDAEIEALLGRLFEIDPGAAADLTASLDLPHSLLRGVFRIWAEVDTTTAIDLLDRVGGAPEEMLLALAILDVGDNAAGLFGRLIAAGQTLDPAGLEVAALVQRARRDPLGAVSDAQRLSGDNAQKIALEEIARASVRSDPASALAAVPLVTDWYLGHEYQAALLGEWAATDMPDFLAHLKTRDPRDPWVANFAELALVSAPISDPYLVLESAEEVGGQLGEILRSAALEGFAEEDPAAALAFVESLAAGPGNDKLLGAVATGYARANLDAALAWVRSLQPPSAAAAYAVTMELASVDLARAVDFDLTTGSNRAPPAWLILRMRGDLSNPGQIADRIASADGARKNDLLRPLMERWAETDPYGALAWIQANEGEASVLVRRIASRLGERDVAQAIDLASLVAPQYRAEWIQRTLVTGSGYDLTGALAELERFRAEPFYAATMSSIINSAISHHGPVVAAELLSRSPALAAHSAVSIAYQWSESDAPSAAAWAMTLSDPGARMTAVQTVLQGWIETDVAAASSWARRLTDDAMREQALSHICSRAPEASHCGV